jgi:ABC-type Mn2+/Zn2+ transport system ATPase subunit
MSPPVTSSSTFCATSTSQARVRWDQHEDGLAIVLTTHDLNGIATHLPHVVCLNTEVIGAGAPHDVLTAEVLERTYGARMDVLEHAGMPFVVEHHELVAAPIDRIGA